MDSPLESLSRPRPSPFLQEDNPSVLSLHQHHMGSTSESILAKSNLENFNNGQVMAFRGSSEELVLKPSNLSLRTSPPEEEMEKMVNPYLPGTYRSPAIYRRPKISPCLSPEDIVPSYSPKDDLYLQKLEHLKRKSPRSKLEKLKERIQEQKRRQNLSKRNPSKSRQNSELHHKSTMKRKVCKVTFGPPSPYSKEEESVPVYSEEGARKREKLRKKSYKNEGDSAFRYSAGKSRALKSKSPITRKMPLRSATPEPKLKCSGLYGASAWREGQRRVQQILGPSPVTLLKHRSPKAEEIHTLQDGSCKKCQKVGSPHNLKHKCPQVLHSSTNELQNRILDCAQVAQEINPGEHRQRPACKIPGKDGERTRDSIRSKSSSPKGPHVTLERRPHGKENAGEALEGHTNTGNGRRYSVDQIRDFMKKKAAERQKTERENQTKMEKAAQMRKEQLDNVIKKQKEVFPPKKGRRSPGVSSKITQKPPGEVADVKKNLSEWLHVTCDDLLRDGHGSSRNSEKQKTETLKRGDHSRPLRPQDLAVVPTMSRDIQVEDIDEGPNDDGVSSHTTHQERLQAIWTTAKDLGRRVDLECDRLGSPNIGTTSVSSPSPGPPPQMAAASDMYDLAGQTEKTFHVHTRKPPGDEERARPGYGDRSPERAKVSTEKTRHREEEYPEKTASPTKTLHEKAQKSSVSCRSAGGSPPRESDVTSPKLLRGTSVSPPRRKTPSPPYSDKMGKRGKPHYGESSSPVTQMEIASKIKTQLQQQEKDLAALRLKAKMEAEEAERCLEEMLRRNNQQSPESPEKRRNCISRDQERGKERFGAGSETCVGLDKSGAGSVSQQNGPITAHVSAAQTETESPEQSWDHTDSTSKWSQVGEFYGSPNMFTRFTLEMSQQYLREEELRARHQSALLRLREEALKEKTKAEVALLHQQKIYWGMRNDPSKVEEVLRQEQEIQRNLKQEQAEIRHLNNIYKAAHQERKLLLRQQKEILRIQQSAAHIQQKLHNSGVTLESEYIPFHDSALASDHVNQDTQSAISDLSEDDDIAEKTESYQAQKIEEGSTSREANFRRSDEAEEKEDYNPDITRDEARRERNHSNLVSGTAEGHSSSGDGTQATGSRQNNPCPSRADLSSHSAARRRDRAHEEIVSGNKSEEDTFEHGQIVDLVAAEEPRNNLSSKDEDEKGETVEELSEGSKIIPTTQEATSDGHVVNEPIHDHSSCSISAPSKSEKLTFSPSLVEFQKVSAKLINISESSISTSDRGKGGEDTESGDSEVFDMESSEFPSRGPSDKEWGGNIINPDGKYVKEGDKSTSSPTERPDSRKPVVLVLKETETSKTEMSKTEMSKTEMAPLACESFPTSEDLTESDTKTYGVNHLPENQDVNVVRITDIHKSTSMSPKANGNVAGMSSPDTKDRQRVTEMNEKQSVTESAICRKIEMMPSDATTSKDLFQIKSFPHRSEGDIIFITDEVLQPDEDTLSEIFSPLDEKLSYDLNQSEELPSLPRDPGSIMSGDSDTEDFPTPPEEILLSGPESLQSSGEANLIEEIHLLYDSFLTEDTLLPPEDMADPGDSPVETSKRPPEVVQPCRPFLTLYKAEEDNHDPISTSEIGDRVLVKLSKTGTLKYKEEFPTPPEEILISGPESLQCSGEAGQIEEIQLLSDSLLMEDALLPPEDMANTGDSTLEISERPPEVVQPCRPFLTLSKAEEAIHDPLSTFEIGDRVLVKLSKTGTLKYKGLTSFKAGYWAGVALDKPEGDNDGTYEGIRYFECSKDCGVFVRPGQISHLLFDDMDGSDPQIDEDDDHSTGEGGAKGGGNRRQRRERDDRKESEKEDVNQDRSRSCSLETSKNINDLQDVDLSPRCFHTYPEEENKNPAWILRIKPFYGGDTNKLFAPNPPQDNKHRLLLKVTGELISLVLCDATGTSSKISAPKKASVMNSRKGEDEKCAGPEEGFCNHPPAMTPRAAGGSAVVTDDGNDGIDGYKKIGRKKDEENMYRPNVTYSCPILAAGEQRTSPSPCGHRTSAIMNFPDGIFEDLVARSLLVMGMSPVLALITGRRLEETLCLPGGRRRAGSP